MSYLKITPQVITDQIPEVAKIQGDWNSTDTYAIYDVVSYDHQLWSATGDVSANSIPSASNSDWQLLGFDPGSPGAIGDVSADEGYFTNLDASGTLEVDGNATLTANLTVSGDATISTNATVQGTLSVAGESTLTGATTIVGALSADDASFTGDVVAPTQATADDSTKVATTAFVKAAISSSNSASLGTIASQNADNVNITGGSVANASVTNVSTLSTSSDGSHTLNGTITVGASVDAETAPSFKVPTVADATNSSTQAASTAFVQAAIDEALDFGGTLGDMAQQNKVSVDITGGSIAGVTLSSSSATLSGGSIDGMAIGSSSAAAGSFTSLSASGNATITGTLGLTGALSAADAAFSGDVTVVTQSPSDNSTKVASTAYVDAAIAAENLGTIATQDADSVNIDGGNIDGTVIGASVAAAASFTTLSASGAVTMSDDATVGGDLVVSGDLTVNGTTTTVNSTVVEIADKAITLASNAANDAEADQAGIVIKGTTDKSLLWDVASGDFESTESLSLASGEEYKINGASVLSSSTLGSGVTASSLTSVGTLSSLDVSGAVTLGDDLSVDGATTLTGALSAADASFSGAVTVVTQAALDNSTKVASTAYVDSAVSDATDSINNTINNLGTMSTQDANSVAIVGGSIDGTAIGGTTAAAGSFTTLAASSTLAVSGASTLAAVSATNVSASGTLAVTGASTLAAVSATNVSASGTLAVTGASTLAAVNATNVAASGTLASTGNFAVNTNKFTVAGASGNTAVAGTLAVTGTSTLGVVNATNVAASGTLASTGNFAVNTDKFKVTASSGNTEVAGTLAVTGVVTASNTIIADNGVSISSGGLVVNGSASLYDGLWVESGAALFDGGATVDNEVLEALAGEYVTGSYTYNGQSAALIVDGDHRIVNGGNLLVSGYGVVDGDFQVLGALYADLKNPPNNVGTGIKYSSGSYAVLVDENNGVQLAPYFYSGNYASLQLHNDFFKLLSNGTPKLELNGSGELWATDLHMSSVLDMNSYSIYNVGNPSSPNDAANKAYVDSVASGLDVKNSVKVATTANITLSGTQTIDGVAVSIGDRVLVKNQTTGSENGIYVVVAGSWPRATDFNADASISAGAFTFVEQGTVNADSGWVLATDGAITIGTTALSFTQFSGAGSIQAGTGLSKSGNTLNVNIGSDVQAYDANTTLLGNTTTGSGSTLVLSAGPTLTGTTSAAAISASGNVSVGGTFAVTGASTLAAVSATNVSASGTLAVTGASTMAAVSAAAVTATSVSTPQVRGSFSLQTASAGNTSKTLTSADSGVLVNAADRAFTVNLPAAQADGTIFTVKKTDSSANAVTIDAAGSELIDGAGTKDLVYANQTIAVLCMSGNWYII